MQLRSFRPDELRRGHNVDIPVVDHLTTTCVFFASNGKLQGACVGTLRGLMAAHDADPRLRDADARARVAALYLPLLGVVMDALGQLHDPVGEGRPRNQAQEVRLGKERMRRNSSLQGA